jgi:hypothetical protein
VSRLFGVIVVAPMALFFSARPLYRLMQHIEEMSQDNMRAKELKEIVLPTLKQRFFFIVLLTLGLCLFDATESVVTLARGHLADEVEHSMTIHCIYYFAWNAYAVLAYSWTHANSDQKDSSSLRTGNAASVTDIDLPDRDVYGYQHRMESDEQVLEKYRQQQQQKQQQNIDVNITGESTGIDSQAGDDTRRESAAGGCSGKIQ